MVNKLEKQLRHIIVLIVYKLDERVLRVTSVISSLISIARNIWTTVVPIYLFTLLVLAGKTTMYRFLNFKYNTIRKYNISHIFFTLYYLNIYLILK